MRKACAGYPGGQPRSSVHADYAEACLSRAAAGIRGMSLIINLPGSPKGACGNLQAVLQTH